MCDYGRMVAMDRGWSWIVLLSAFVGMALSLGVILSLTVYLDDLKLEFGIGSSEAGTIMGICLAFTTITGPAASYVCNKIGFRLVFICSGLMVAISMVINSITKTYWQMLCSSTLTGISFSLSYTSASVIMGYYFKQYYVLVNGIVFSGVYAGMFGFPVLFEYLRSFYNWRACFRLIAAICLHICVAGALIRQPPKQHINLDTNDEEGSRKKYNQTIKPDDDDNDNEGRCLGNEDKNSCEACLENSGHPDSCPDNFFEKTNKERIDKSAEENKHGARIIFTSTRISRFFCNIFEFRLFLNLKFSILFMIMYIYSVGYMGSIVHFVARAKWSGLTPSQAGFLLSMMGFGGVTSRLLHGYIVDKKYMSAMHMFFICLVASAMFTITLTFISSNLWSQVVSFLIGLSSGALAPLTPVIMKDIVGVERLKSAFGLAIVSYGLADLSGSFLTGWIYDLTNDYNKSFYMTSACLLLAALLVLIIGRLQSSQLLHSKSEQENTNV